MMRLLDDPALRPAPGAAEYNALLQLLNPVADPGLLEAVSKRARRCMAGDPSVDAAAESYLRAGLLCADGDVGGLVRAETLLREAMRLGSDDAIGWLGAVLVDLGARDDRASPELSAQRMVEGLGWLDVSRTLGHEFGERALSAALKMLPNPLIDAWQGQRPGFVVTTH